MTTANEITDGAYRLCGIRTPDTDQDTDALLALNEMIALWSADGLTVPYLTRETFTLVQGTPSYTIGSGGTFDTVRPMVIEAAMIRDSDSIDSPVDPRLTQEEYNLVPDKSVQGRPDRLFYDTQYSLGVIYMDPVPEAAHSILLFSRKALTAFASISATMDLPGEYAKALRYNLALDMAPEIPVTLETLVIRTAGAAVNLIRDLNSGPVRWVKLDPALTYAVLR
ncbi:MAG TPA: hypothetical protein ENH84_00300 [Phycisphaerae bacterium]|nr:hypothetical protein [Phycisphaerae bacterium]